MSESAKVKSTKGAKSEDKKTKVAAPVEAAPAPVETKSKKTSAKAAPVEAAPAPVAVAAPVEAKPAKKSSKTAAVEATPAPVAVAAPVEAKPAKKSSKQTKAAKPAKGAKGKAAKGAKAAAPVEVADDPKKRYFHCVYKNGEGEVVRAGRYSGKKPKQAARKALSRVVDKNELPIGQSITFLIKECTRGRKKKAYSYTGSRVLLETPVTVEIKKKDGTPAKLVYKHDNVVKKVALTECADLLNIEFNDEEEHQQAEEAAVVKVKKVSKGGAKAASTKSASSKGKAPKAKPAKVEAAPAPVVAAPVAAAPVAAKAAKATKAKAK